MAKSTRLYPPNLSKCSTTYCIQILIANGNGPFRFIKFNTMETNRNLHHYSSLFKVVVAKGASLSNLNKKPWVTSPFQIRLMVMMIAVITKWFGWLCWWSWYFYWFKWFKWCWFKDGNDDDNDCNDSNLDEQGAVIVIMIIITMMMIKDTWFLWSIIELLLRWQNKIFDMLWTQY